MVCFDKYDVNVFCIFIEIKTCLFRKSGIILHFNKRSFGCEKRWMKGEKRKNEETERNKAPTSFHTSLYYSCDTMWTTSKHNNIERKSYRNQMYEF